MTSMNNIPSKTRSFLTQTFILIALLGLATALSACNTTEGAGKDIKAVGKAIEDTADDAKD